MSTRLLTAVLLLCVGASSALAQRWSQVQLPAPYDEGYYLDIYFLPSNTQYGWACDNDSGFVVRTTNGGQSWQGTRVTASGYCHLEYIQFLNTTTGYCSGPCGVFKSTDGGASWSALNLGVPDSLVWGGWFKSVNEGWVTGGGCAHNNFYHTTDGGTSWERYQDTLIKRSNLSDPLWQSDMAAGEVYAIGNGTLWKSTDDGANWAVESYTGTTSPWHEEIARYGNTFLVACAGSNCKLDYTSGGMRWSHDGGSTWNAYDIGNDMFGCFLLSNQTAWASGRNGNVWYTANGGTTWGRRDCGLNGKHMDDIFFVNDSTGWVVGDGLYHLDKPRRTITDSVMEFLGACPDSSLRDTIWVANENFSESPWTIELVGDDAWMYRVANVIPKPIPSCTPVPVIVEYRATLGGLHTAQMHIRIQNPDTLLVVDLRGQRRLLNARPVDTLIVFNQKVGTPISRVLEWRATSAPIEAIVNIVRDTGSSILNLVSAFPQPINVVAPICQTPITGTLADTGWVTARFRVTLSPCMRDTFITVQVYGVSGIINAPKTATATLGCKQTDTLFIPVANSGNAPLTIYSASLVGLSPEVFAVLGMKNAGKTAPWTIDTNRADTLIVLAQPTGKVHQAVLQIFNDDATTTRGKVQPWEVALTITWSAPPSLVLQPQKIDLGVMCLTARKDTSFEVTNTSIYDGMYSIPTLKGNVSLKTFGSRYLRTGATNTERFTYTANSLGIHEDTITIVGSPCSQTRIVVVTVNVVDQVISILPTPLVDSIDLRKTLTRSITIKNISAVPVTVTSVAASPTDADLSVTAAVPAAIAVGDSLVVQITWTPTTVKTLVTELLVETDGLCAAQGAIELHSMSNTVGLSKNSVVFDLGCKVIVSIDSVVVSAKGSAASFAAPRLASNNPAITILRPTQPFIVDQKQPVAILVAYDPTKQRNATDTLLLEMTDGTGTLQIPLHGTSTYTRWDVQPKEVQFEASGVCDTILVSKVVVSNFGPDPISVIKQNSATPSWVDVTNMQGQPLPIILAGTSTDTLLFVCNTAMLPSGTTATTVDLVEAECGTSKTVAVSANVVGGLLVLFPNPIDAGVVDTGTTVLRNAYITNPTTSPLTIASLQITSGQGAWVLLDAVSGRTLAPAVTLSVDLQFTPRTVGEHPGILTLVQADLPCNKSISTNLVGEGRLPAIPPKYTLLLSAATARATAGDRVAIPITWQSDVSAAGIDSAAFSIDYYRLLLHADTIVAGAMPDMAVTYSFVPGTVSVMLRGLGADAGKAGTVATLDGIAALAIPDSTLFTFRNVRVWARDTVTVTTDPGLLIVDACGPRNLISLAAPTAMHIVNPQPVHDKIVIQITAPYSEQVMIQVSDIQGATVSTYPPIHVGSGTTEVSVPIGVVASGTYVVRATTGRGGVFSMPVLIVR